jgi:hypothetical protein
MKKFDEFITEGGSAIFDEPTLKRMFHARMDFLDEKLQNRLSALFGSLKITQKETEELTDIIEDIYNAGIEFEEKGFKENKASKGAQTHHIKTNN